MDGKASRLNSSIKEFITIKIPNLLRKIVTTFADDSWSMDGDAMSQLKSAVISFLVNDLKMKQFTFDFQ